MIKTIWVTYEYCGCDSEITIEQYRKYNEGSIKIYYVDGTGFIFAGQSCYFCKNDPQHLYDLVNHRLKEATRTREEHGFDAGPAVPLVFDIPEGTSW